MRVSNQVSEYKTANNVVRVTVRLPDLYFKSKVIWFSKILMNISVRYYKEFRKFHESVSTAKEYTFTEEAMDSKTKELTFLKFSHVRDQTQLQSPQAEIYVNLVLIYLLETCDVFFSPVMFLHHKDRITTWKTTKL
jgi:hypothetical protein